MRVAYVRDRLKEAASAVWRFMAPATPPAPRQAAKSQHGDLDLRVIWQALVDKRKWILVPTAAVFVLAMVGVNTVTPRYKSEARILIDGRDNIFLRPTGERSEERGALDDAAIASQVQLLLSRELALEVIRKNKLDKLPEFDPVLNGISPLKSLLLLVGIGRDPLRLTPEERVLGAYYDRLTAYAVDKSRVMVVEFLSSDPKLSAKVTNSIADGYLVMQQAARQEQAKTAGQWLSGEIDSLRKKVSEAEDRVEAFRSKSNLFVGTNNTTLSNQQLGELNTQLNNARAQKSDAETRAHAIRTMLQSGRPIEASEVLNSDLVRRLSEQRVTLRAQLAEQSSTLMDRHPRIKELKAQIADLDRQIREEAGKLSRAFENDARIAGARMDGLNASLDQLKSRATSTNSEEVQLRALEREAKAQRDLLETYLAKYREATTRETIDSAPADGRIISRAIVSNTPAYPKKLPIVLIATLVTLLLTSGYIATAELLKMTTPWGTSDDGVAVSDIVRGSPAMPFTLQIEQLAATLRQSGERARKITLIGAGEGSEVSNTALALARQLARDSRALLIGLSPSGMDGAAHVPGLSDLARGVASFGQIINRDTRSSLHIISAGVQPERALLTSPRVVMALDALMHTYDHVVLDAGTAADLPSSLIASHAHAVILPAPGLSEAAKATMRSQLLASGFVGVSILEPAASEAPQAEVAAA